MGSSDVSLISVHPFFRRFVFSIIQNIRSANLNYEKRDVIHADLVPKVSERVMMASMAERPLLIDKREEVVDVAPKRDGFESMRMSELIAPIEKPIARRMPIVPRAHIETVNPPIRLSPVVESGAVTIDTDGYGKIAPLLGDPSVSSIDCKGAEKSITVIRAGQRQTTRVALSEKEIGDILGKVADEAHIPLLEGVFRASISEFSVNAVISKTIGFRFLIRKVTAYNLLE